MLAGDAAAGVSLLGEGSSLAIAGAAPLARSLAEHPVEQALHAYEHTHRAHTTPRGRGASLAGHLLVPATATGLAVRDLALRAVSGVDERSTAGRWSR